MHPIDWSAFSDTPSNPNEGDLVLQICANSAYAVEHLLHRIEHTLVAQFTVVYTLMGEQRNGGGTPQAPLTADTARGLIGFHDGLSNLDPKNQTDQQLIFVDPTCTIPFPPTPPAGPQPPPGPGQPGYGQPTSPAPSFPNLRPAPTTPEPAWATGGSYLTVRASLLNMTTWDNETLQNQQQTIGRYKYSGATLDNPNEPAHRHDDPAFAATPTNVTVPPNSHLRRANPRALPTDTDRRIFRRGYPMILPASNGTVQRGLLFLAYSRTITTQTEFILAAWLKNPNFPEQNAGIDPLLQLEVSVLAGGNYFVPAVLNPDEPWNWNLPGI